MSWVVRMLVVLPALAAAGRAARADAGAASPPASPSRCRPYVAVLALIQWVAPSRTADIDTIGRLPLGDLSVPLHLLSDRVSGLVSFVVALVVLGIQVFTAWYLRDDPRYGQFAATVSLFAAGMLLLVQSGDLVLMLVGWEVMGWCSWLLIGHDSERPAARRAAYKAFLVTRVADIGMVVGIIALSVRARSTDLMAVLTATGDGTLLTVGLVGVVIGVAGKSGLVPFHDWLPDAMEGPTPASALIHAATMVAAGTYVIARLFPLYAEHDGARTLLAVLAAVTMVYAALLALAQTDLKRMLAYSTLSQVAIMLSALAAAPAELGPGAGHLAPDRPRVLQGAALPRRRLALGARRRDGARRAARSAAGRPARCAGRWASASPPSPGCRRSSASSPRTPSSTPRSRARRAAAGSAPGSSSSRSSSPSCSPRPTAPGPGCSSTPRWPRPASCPPLRRPSSPRRTSPS